MLLETHLTWNVQAIPTVVPRIQHGLQTHSWGPWLDAQLASLTTDEFTNWFVEGGYAQAMLSAILHAFGWDRQGKQVGKQVLTEHQQEIFWGQLAGVLENDSSLLWWRDGHLELWEVLDGTLCVCRCRPEYELVRTVDPWT